MAHVHENSRGIRSKKEAKSQRASQLRSGDQVTVTTPVSTGPVLVGLTRVGASEHHSFLRKEKAEG